MHRAPGVALLEREHDGAIQRAENFLRLEWDSQLFLHVLADQTSSSAGEDLSYSSPYGQVPRWDDLVSICAWVVAEEYERRWTLDKISSELYTYNGNLASIRRSEPSESCSTTRSWLPVTFPPSTGSMHSEKLSIAQYRVGLVQVVSGTAILKSKRAGYKRASHMQKFPVLPELLYRSRVCEEGCEVLAPSRESGTALSVTAPAPALASATAVELGGRQGRDGSIRAANAGITSGIAARIPLRVADIQARACDQSSESTPEESGLSSPPLVSSPLFLHSPAPTLVPIMDRSMVSGHEEKGRTNGEPFSSACAHAVVMHNNITLVTYFALKCSTVPRMGAGGDRNSEAVLTRQARAPQARSFWFLLTSLTATKSGDADSRSLLRRDLERQDSASRSQLWGRFRFGLPILSGMLISGVCAPRICSGGLRIKLGHAPGDVGMINRHLLLGGVLTENPIQSPAQQVSQSRRIPRKKQEKTHLGFSWDTRKDRGRSLIATPFRSLTAGNRRECKRCSGTLSWDVQARLCVEPLCGEKPPNDGLVTIPRQAPSSPSQPMTAQCRFYMTQIHAARDPHTAHPPTPAKKHAECYRRRSACPPRGDRCHHAHTALHAAQLRLPLHKMYLRGAATRHLLVQRERSEYGRRRLRSVIPMGDAQRPPYKCQRRGCQHGTEALLQPRTFYVARIRAMRNVCSWGGGRTGRTGDPWGGNVTRMRGYMGIRPCVPCMLPSCHTRLWAKSVQRSGGPGHAPATTSIRHATSPAPPSPINDFISHRAGLGTSPVTSGHTYLRSKLALLWASLRGRFRRIWTSSKYSEGGLNAAALQQISHATLPTPLPPPTTPSHHRITITSVLHCCPGTQGRFTKAATRRTRGAPSQNTNDSGMIIAYAICTQLRETSITETSIRDVSDGAKLHPAVAAEHNDTVVLRRSMHEYVPCTLCAGAQIPAQETQ
ncbi:hypothetical protein C8R43DRAFT_965800 [Mycena crocata]|nr:hypothetical protein C8R43DRAFT_965800 [Mycena crocata]